LLQWKSSIPIRVRGIRQKGWTGLAEPKVIESTLETLEDGHWVKSVENVKTRSGGRPTTSYVLHPEAEKWMGILKCHTTETNKTGAEVGSG
jgi:predicted transcriptional regulator